MFTENVIQFLKIFGLIVFDIFFLIMIILSVYLFFVIANIKKQLSSIENEIKKTITSFEEDSYSLVSSLKSKIESVDGKKIVLGSTLLGGLFSIFTKGFYRKNKSKSIVRSLIDIFW
jgi:hypothetical protein